MRKSRLWTAVSAVVGLAALVVLASCQGPVGAAGAAGATGAKGDTGPAGGTGPGTTDNASPVVAKAIPTVYLALNGPAFVKPASTAPTNVAASDTGYKTKTVDLTTAFTDAESPAGLVYTAVSTDPKIATVSAATTTGVVAAPDKLLITGKTAGPTEITATAFDGVNPGVSTTFNVIVVQNNSAPTAGVTRDILDLTGTRKLISDSAREIVFTAAVDAGASGEPTEAVTFRAQVGTGVSTGVDKAPAALVSASVKHDSGNNYILTVTRLSPGLNERSVMQNIWIFATDSFGAEVMVNLNGDDVTNDPDMTSLIAEMNAPPALAQALPDIVLYRSETGAAEDAEIAPTDNKRGGVFYDIPNYFAVEYFVAASNGNPERAKDTTCVFTTSPKQPTGLGPTVPSNNMPWVVASAVVDPIKATTMASVRGAYQVTVPTAELNMVTIDASPVTSESTPVGVTAEGLGYFDLTITCSDAETSVSDTARITVRP